MVIDVQSNLMIELQALLGSVPGFGTSVFEDSVLRVLDSADPEMPDRFIVLQPGATEEIERAGQGSVRERTTVNITLITKERNFAPALRAGRVAVKVALAGTKAGLAERGVQGAVFVTETPMPPGQGRSWAAHVMPLQITYVQPLK